MESMRFARPLTHARFFGWLVGAGLMVLPSASCGSCGASPLAEKASPAKQPAPGDEEITPGNPDLPGIDHVDGALDEKLQNALAAKPPEYEPRTHHTEPDGSPKYTNRLILETSPYLLQHAHNPVNWFSWGKDAFERAKKKDKPVFLSIGYSTCHWCHVMARETFEDVEAARYINEHFIPIKVDREVRPDVDDLYMKAVHMLHGSGGWPMTVVLTPDRKPFFGGTYFPKQRMMSILNRLVKRYEQNKKELVAKAKEITQKVQRVTRPEKPADIPGAGVLVQAAQQMGHTFDARYGGFGGGTKFPQPSRLKFLLRFHRRSGNEAALRMVRETLWHMASGGIHDHVGGGFHRYSTDARWLVPHFEKMLYTNAQLASVYLEAWQATGERRFRRVAARTLDYVARDMTAPNGGFYSATNADSPTPEGHEEEGYFFTWTPQEIDEVLGPERALLVKTYYDVTADGNFEGRNILHTPKPVKGVAQELDMEVGPLRRELEASREALYKAREQRPHPHRDEKILAAWNGLMIGAFAQGALVLDEPRYAKRATEAADRVLDVLRNEQGRLLRSYRDGEARQKAYLIDYAAMIDALLDLYETTSELRWLQEALALQKKLDAYYLDEKRGGYYRTADDHEELLAREKPADDGSMPSGNSLQVKNLLRLAEYTGSDKWKKRAERLLAAFGRDLQRRPHGMTQMLVGLDYYLDVPLEVILMKPTRDATGEPLLSRLRSTFLPNRVLSLVAEPEREQHAQLIPLLEGKTAQGGETTAYVCERGSCELPTSKPKVFERQIREVRKPLSREVEIDIMKPEEIPEPWEYDAERNRYWHPGHRHWHGGKPPPRHR